MPAGNNMGPEGEGPMTGRGMGNCTGYPEPGFHSARFGYGSMFRGGRGRRFHHLAYGRRFFYPHPQGCMYAPAANTFEPQPVSAEEEEHILSQQASWLQEQLDLINARLDKIKTKGSSEEE